MIGSIARLKEENYMNFAKNILFSLVLLYAGTALSVTEITPSFNISEVYVSTGDNMHFRVIGINSSLCPGNSHWAYINKSDDGSESKISALLTAYAAKKNVKLIIEPVNFYNNGTMFCHIVELSISG